MNTLMFFYTLAILVICIVTAVLSLAAYASSRRRFFIYGGGEFICYAVEMTEIFFFEYTLQNQSFPASDYYAITMPVARTLVATASQAFIWLIAMDLLDKHSKKLFVIPVATFLLSELLIIVAVPCGPMHQWLYYTMRQVFLVFVGLYIFWTAHKSTKVELKARVNNQRKHLIIGAILDAYSKVIPKESRIYILMAALTLISWTGVARLVRGQILYLREQEYMTAAEALGLPTGHKIFKHLVPNVMPQLIVSMTLSLGSMILYEATLGYLDLGVPYPKASWGNMIYLAKNTDILSFYPNIWVPSGVCIVLAILAFNFIGDGLRDALDPKMKR